MNQGDQIPVFLLTGFLGSGKTTVLARLLADPRFEDTAVIVNEFGEVGLDHRLLSRGEEESVVLLENGCLCCAAGDSLGETLIDLFHRRGRKAIPHFSRVVIETSGMADPTAILATLLADRFMAAKFRVAAVIATIDAESGRETVARYPEAAAQLALADRLLLTKRDRVSAGDEKQLCDWLATENPRAERMVADNGDVDPVLLLREAESILGRPLPHHHAHHSGRVGTIFLAIPGAIGWEEYAGIVASLQTVPGLLRCKGVIRIRGERGLLAVQGVRKLFAPPFRISDDPDARTGLVLIGEELDADVLGRALASFGVVQSAR